MAYIGEWVDDIFFCRFYDRVTFSDLTDATDRFYADYRCERVTGTVWDFLDMVAFEVDETHATEMAYTDHVASRYVKAIKSAFVTNDPDFEKLVEQYIAEMAKLRANWDNKIFHLRDAARTWVAA